MTRPATERFKLVNLQACIGCMLRNVNLVNPSHLTSVPYFDLVYVPLRDEQVVLCISEALELSLRRELT
jgi:hypothetical protein